MFAFAVKARMRADNPVESSDRIKVAAGEKSTGYHAWSEAEIAQYRAFHALGTRPRLALEILLWSGQRRGDAYLFGDQHIVDCRIELKQKKGGKQLGLLIMPQLRAAIEAMPPRLPEATAFLLTDWGRPYTSAGFGNWFRECCDDAGLPHCTAHGLRKAIMRRAAELELGNQSLKSISGHTEDAEVALYTASASQRRLADSALKQISEWEVSHLSQARDTSQAQDDEI
ncbi:tyrosine-type recombinase/integrase [Sphingomonas qilianensis]|uniref:Tyrosine-type recombinase/integrase n=1 Tax=Sphingomonas qilianensis TaxID=1736690 RepID=A0ABU9XTL6_9SPHN